MWRRRGNAVLSTDQFKYLYLNDISPLAGELSFERLTTLNAELYRGSTGQRRLSIPRAYYRIASDSPVSAAPLK